jgi:hypothetical protein
MINRRQRIILFASPEQLKMLFTGDTILMDGTFSSCPKIFDQVYTVHTIKYEQCELLYLLIPIVIYLILSPYSFSLRVWFITKQIQKYLPVFISGIEICSYSNETRFCTENSND